MRSRFLLLGTVAALSFISTSNSNAHQQGWYIGLEAGANWIGKNNFTIDTTYHPKSSEALSYGTPFNGFSFGSLDFDTGWAGFVTIGYGFEDNWRVELEGGYRSNDFTATEGKVHALTKDTSAAPYTADQLIYNGHRKTYTADGSLDEWTAMVNVIYDVPLAEKLDLSIGVGAGLDFSNVEVVGLKDSDVNFAYQAIVGLNYKITKRLDLTLNYRYLNVDAPSYEADIAYGKHTAHYVANLDDVEKHTVTVGLRYDLYEEEAPVVAPPPPPPPAAEPEQFVIFFGFNKCNITAEADSVLSEAAAAAKAQGSASVLIVGHTDTVGSNSYNQKLSECRANAAKAGLVAKGIGEGQVSATGRGETELLVKTGDGVKEPQNRRATIDLKK